MLGNSVSRGKYLKNTQKRRFYYSFFRSYKFINEKLVPHIYGIRDEKNIDVEGMKSIGIPYPGYQEQKKIGDFYMSEQKKLINFTVVCVNEFARKHNLSAKEAFQYLFQFKGIEFIKENYESEHTLSFDTILEDVDVLCQRNGGML